jgi:uncharacterized tellurite resistance protein B-like protein
LYQWAEQQLAETDRAVIDGGELIRRWSSTVSAKLAKPDAVALAQLLARRGYGIEPDIRFDGPPISSGPTVLFRLSGSAPSVAGPTYRAAAVLLHLSAVVSFADGDLSEAERLHLVSHLETGVDLQGDERQRLAAHLVWLATVGAGLAVIKRRLNELQPDRRRAIGEFLVGVAAIDGMIGPGEISVLEKIFKLLGLEPSSVYSAIHVLEVEGAANTGPVQVRSAKPGRSGEPIPRRPTMPREGMRLDQNLIEAKLAESAAVSTLLSTIFIEGPTESSTLASSDKGVTADENVERLPGLDGQHSAFVRSLASRSTWSRPEVEALAAEAGLLTDGALDTINEAAIRRCDDLLCEGDAEISVNTEALEGLLSS